jgi:hypothetical protein
MLLKVVLTGLQNSFKDFPPIFHYLWNSLNIYIFKHLIIAMADFSIFFYIEINFLHLIDKSLDDKVHRKLYKSLVGLSYVSTCNVLLPDHNLGDIILIVLSKYIYMCNLFCIK